MDRLVITFVALICAALALAKLRQLSRWRQGEATTLMRSNRVGSTYTGQEVPISFRLPDGTLIVAMLRIDFGTVSPRAGTRIAILYDPTAPSNVVWAWSVSALVGAVVGALLVAAGVWLA